jgi:hypothetical protein
MLSGYPNPASICQTRPTQAVFALKRPLKTGVRKKPLIQHQGGAECKIYQHENIINAWLNASMMRLGQQPQWVALVQRATLIIESIILHELVHWGDATADGIYSDGEAIQHGWKDLGHMFVHHAYGAQFAVEKDRIRHRKVKIPKMDIEGWMGWGVVRQEGKTYAIPYDPWHGRGPGSGPPLPPGSIRT